GLRPGLLQPLEHLPATQRPLELADEFLQVVLYDPVQVDQVAIDIVEHLHLGRYRAQKIQRCTAGERLDVAAVAREQGKDAIGETALAAYPGDDGLGLHEASWPALDGDGWRLSALKWLMARHRGHLICRISN